MALTETEWQYVDQFFRHVRPKLPADQSDHAKSRMFVLHSKDPLESVHKHVLALEKSPHFTLDKIFASYLSKIRDDSSNKDPRGAYLTDLIARMSQKYNLGQEFEKSNCGNIPINHPAKLDHSLVAGPSVSLPKSSASSDCEVQMVFDDQPVEILLNKLLEIAMNKVSLIKSRKSSINSFARHIFRQRPPLLSINTSGIT